MRLLDTVAAILLFAAMLPMAPAAQADDRSPDDYYVLEEFVVGNWFGGAAYAPPDQTYAGCSIMAPPKKGLGLSFVNYDGELTLYVSNDEWAIGDPKAYNFEIQIDEGHVYPLGGWGQTHRITASLPDDERLHSSLRSGHVLKLITAQRIYRLSLEGSAAALRRLEHCDRDHSNVAVANPFEPAPDGNRSVERDAAAGQSRAGGGFPPVNPFAPQSPEPERAEAAAPSRHSETPTEPRGAAETMRAFDSSTLSEVPEAAAYMMETSEIIDAFLDLSEVSLVLDRVIEGYVGGEYQRSFASTQGKKMASQLLAGIQETTRRYERLPEVPSVENGFHRHPLEANAQQLAEVKRSAYEDVVMTVSYLNSVLEGDMNIEHLKNQKQLSALVIGFRRRIQEIEGAILELPIPGAAYHHRSFASYSYKALISGVNALFLEPVMDQAAVDYAARAELYVLKSREDLGLGKWWRDKARIDIERALNAEGLTVSEKPDFETLLEIQELDEMRFDLDRKFIDEISHLIVLAQDGDLDDQNERRSTWNAISKIVEQQSALQDRRQALIRKLP